MNVFELFATLGLDTTAYDEGLEGAEKTASSFGSKLKTGLGVAAGVATTAVAATTAATVAGTKAFIDGLKATSEYGDEIDKTSQRLGISAEKYQQFDYVMNIAGTSMSNMTIGMKTMTNQLDKAKEGSEDAISNFEALGISLEDIQTMSREDLFEKVIYGFQNMDESVERAALANEMFGRSGQELTPLFNMTAEETQNLIDKASEYGMVMSDDAVKASAGFKDSLTTLNSTLTGFKNNTLSQFMPAVTTIVEGLSAVFAGKDGGLDMINEGVQNFATNLSKVLPEFIRVGGQIISSLAVAIIQNAPTLIESGMDAFGMLVDALIDNADMIIESAVAIINLFILKITDAERAAKFAQAAVDIISKLALGLTDALPVLIPAVISVVVEIVKVLTEPDNLTLLISASLQLIMALADGIVDALPELVSVIPTVIFNLTEALIDNAPEVTKTVLYLIGALGYAILDALGTLLGQTLWEITSRFSEIISKAKEFGFKIGEWLSSGVQKITSKIKSFFNGAISTFTTSFSNMKEKVSSFFTNAVNFFVNGFNNMKQRAEDGLNNIREKFTNIFENAKNTVKNAIEFIKGLFNFEWSLPKLKLPHLTVTGQLDLFAVPPKIPSVSVEWYKKAMNQPYLLDEATIFGAANGKLLGAGESGSELVIGTNKLMSMIRQASGGPRDITVNVYGAEGQDIRLLAKEVSKEIQNLINDKEKVYA